MTVRHYRWMLMAMTGVESDVCECLLLYALKQQSMWCILYNAKYHILNYGICHPSSSRRHRSPEYCDNHAGSNYTQTATIMAYSHCVRLRDATLCSPYSHYVLRIAAVWLAKIESKSNYLQKNQIEICRN